MCPSQAVKHGPKRAELVWDREWPSSRTNFDLILKNRMVHDMAKLASLLQNITRRSHRGITLTASAGSEFARWFADPQSPLKAHAYVGLSNWFLSGGNSSSELARHCEVLWDALFAARPPKRLSSAEKGRNHKVLPEAFDLFWSRLVEAQENSAESNIGAADGNLSPFNGGGPSRVTAKIHAKNLLCEAEGTPEAVAQLLRLIASWNDSKSLPEEDTQDRMIDGKESYDEID